MFVAAVTVVVTGVVLVSATGENVTVIPLGAPLADSVTGEVKLPCVVSDRVTALDLPCATDKVEELVVIPKLEPE